MRKKLFAALLAVCMVMTLLPVTAMAATFDDVPESEWYAASVERWADYGVLNGVGEGQFSPDRAMNRAEFAKMVVTLLGLTNKSGKTFPDVEADSSLAWAKDVIDIAATNGIITGYSDGSFGGKREVTFTAGATMLSRALGLVSVEESSGAAYATAAVEKLTALEMLDENVKADMDFNRAGVAGLADKMIAVYATEDKPLEEAVTGEVKGVILAVGTEVVIENATVAAPIVVNEGAKVEVKNSTVTAPIVVTSAEVTLTATKAEDVKVSGEKAAVTADKDSTVADVTVAGEAPAVELNGKVEGTVTVEAGTTDVEIKGDGVSADKVENNTTEDIKVNGETVEGKPAEENPDENKEDEKKPSTTNPVIPDEPGTDPDPEDKEEDPKPAETHNHKYAVTSSEDATCTKAGKKVYTCSAEGTCEKKTYEEVIPALGHDYDADTGECKNGCGTTKPADHDECTEFDEQVIAATCTTDGKTIKTCKVCGKVETVDGAKAAHTPKDVAAVEATCTKGGLTKGSVCEVCGETITAQETVKAKGHTEVVDKAVAATCTTKGKTEGKHCSVCETVITAQTETPVDPTTHTKVIDQAVAATCKDTGLTQGSHCSACNKVFEEQEVVPVTGEHSYEEKDVETDEVDSEGNKITVKKSICSVCGAEEQKSEE